MTADPREMAQEEEKETQLLSKVSRVTCVLVTHKCVTYFYFYFHFYFMLFLFYVIFIFIFFHLNYFIHLEIRT